MKKILPLLLLLALSLSMGCRNANRHSTSGVAVDSGQTSAVDRAAVANVPSTNASAPAAPAPERREGVQVWTRPFLYRGAFKQKEVHVFGTIHLPDARLEQFPAALETALSSAEVVFTEIPMDDATQAAIAPTLMLPETQSLSQLLPPALYQRVSAAFNGAGIPFEPFDRMKPWAVSVQLSVLDRLMTMALEKPIDAVLYQRAHADGKQTAALETAREQLGIFEGLTPHEQVELLRLTMDSRDSARKERRDVLAELLDAYVQGDEASIDKLVREAFDPKSALSLKLMRQTITDRNRSMAERVLAETVKRPERKLFFAVGCGHVVGNDGLIARLRQQHLDLIRVVP